jgi:hypothetical protein
MLLRNPKSLGLPVFRRAPRVSKSEVEMLGVARLFAQSKRKRLCVFNVEKITILVEEEIKIIREHGLLKFHVKTNRSLFRAPEAWREAD